MHFFFQKVEMIIQTIKIIEEGICPCFLAKRRFLWTDLGALCSNGFFHILGGSAFRGQRLSMAEGRSLAMSKRVIVFIWFWFTNVLRAFCLFLLRFLLFFNLWFFTRIWLRLIITFLGGSSCWGFLLLSQLFLFCLKSCLLLSQKFF